MRMDRVFREVKDLVPADELELLTPSTVHGVVPQSSLDSKPQQAFRDGYQVAPAQPGDFVISLSSHAHGIEWCGLSGGISPDYTLLRPIVDRRYGRYLKHALKSHYVISQLGVFKTGVRMGLRLQWNKVRYCTIDLPTLSTAIALADHLDRATARIDNLIARKIRFIELLREKRQAQVTHAVSKGLDANAPKRDSGVEWLGEVPAHWAKAKCGHFMSILSGYAFPSSGYDPEGNGTRLLRGVNVGVGKLRWDDVAFWKRTPCDGLESFELRAGDLVIGMDRPQIADGVRIAHVTEADLPCLLLQRVASLRTKPTLSSEFLFYCLSTPMFVAHFSPDTTGISVPHISPEQIASFVIAVPPLGEQRRIVDHIGVMTTKLDALIEKTERSIELLREHRIALVTAAVTGKIDLREAA